MNTIIQKLIYVFEFVFYIFVVLVHILTIFLLFTHKEIEFIPWYLVLGTILVFFFYKSVHSFLLRHTIYTYNVLNIINKSFVIPVVSVVVLILLFVSPELLSLHPQELAIVIKISNVQTGCNSGVYTGKILNKGQSIVVENRAERCVRVSAINDAVGYIPIGNIKFLATTTIDKLKKIVVQLVAVTVSFYLILKIFIQFHYTMVIPYLLNRLSRKNEHLIKVQLEQKFFFEDTFFSNSIMNELDLQEAKSDLIIKIAQRYQDQTDSILNSTTLSGKEKKMALNKLLSLTMKEFQ